MVTPTVPDLQSFSDYLKKFVDETHHMHIHIPLVNNPGEPMTDIKYNTNTNIDIEVEAEDMDPDSKHAYGTVHANPKLFRELIETMQDYRSLLVKLKKKPDDFIPLAVTKLLNELEEALDGAQDEWDSENN